MSDMGIVVCNDCGAFSESEATIPHSINCVPGDAEKWEKYHENQPSQEEQDKEDKEYEEYLKQEQKR
jgi:hypothetical protein